MARGVEKWGLYGIKMHAVNDYLPLIYIDTTMMVGKDIDILVE